MSAASVAMEDYTIRVRARGLRATPKCMAVIDLFLEKGSYMSPSEVRQCLQRRFTSIGLPTVYRLLDNLDRIGVLSTVKKEDRQLYYYLCRRPGQAHHHHFICRICRRVEEVDLCVFEAVARHVEDALSARAESHLLQIEGLCARCK